MLSAMVWDGGIGMKQTILSAQALSQLCREMELMLRAGILTADALRLLEREDPAQ